MNSILEKKWFWPVVIVLVLAVVNLVMYINLNSQVKALNIRTGSLEKTISQLSKTGKEVVPGEVIILPEGGVAPKEELIAPEGEILFPEEENLTHGEEVLSPRIAPGH